MSTDSKQRHERLAWVYAAALDQAQVEPETTGFDLAREARLQRIVQELVDLADERPSFFLSLAGLRDTGDVHAEHAVAVAVLAISLGRQLGLHRHLRAELGIIALHYDAGWRDVAPEIADDPTLWCVLALAGLASHDRYDAPAFRRALVTRDYRKDWAPVDGIAPYPLAQLIRIANDFDTMTRGTDEERPRTLSQAVASLEDGAGVRYHPALVETFLDMLGMQAEPVPEGQPKKKLTGSVLGALKLKALKKATT